jgi:hypothetical protein
MRLVDIHFHKEFIMSKKRRYIGKDALLLLSAIALPVLLGSVISVMSEWPFWIFLSVPWICLSVFAFIYFIGYVSYLIRRCRRYRAMKKIIRIKQEA